MPLLSGTNLTQAQNLSGAGRGNRTLVGSLGSYCSTIKLYPLRAADFVPDVRRDLKFFFKNVWVTGVTLDELTQCRSELARERLKRAAFLQEASVILDVLREQVRSCKGAYFRVRRHAVSGPVDSATG